MYLTRHGYRFQWRIPADLMPILGKSPVRPNLGNTCSRPVARVARLLVGCLSRLFLGILTEGHRKRPKAGAGYANGVRTGRSLKKLVVAYRRMQGRGETRSRCRPVPGLPLDCLALCGLSADLGHRVYGQKGRLRYARSHQTGIAT